MRVEVAYGHKHANYEIAEEDRLSLKGCSSAETINDPYRAMLEALEHPYEFPPLRRALTPDDHVTIVVDESIPKLGVLLTGLLEYLHAAEIDPDCITLVCLPPTTDQPWLDELPDRFEEVKLEVHDPTDRKRLSYLATTRSGRRVYLNRSAVDADLLLILSRQSFDLAHGYCGALNLLFPGLADESTQKDLAKHPIMPANGHPSEQSKETAEVAWLVGAPFLIQAISGPEDSLFELVTGMNNSNDEAQRKLRDHWYAEVDELADVVVAGISGDPRNLTFAEMAKALANAARVVKPAGRIALLTDSNPNLDNAAEYIRSTASSSEVLEQLHRHPFEGREAAFLWASATETATVYLLSGWESDVAEELMTVPLDNAEQVQRLLAGHQRCVFLPDANKMMIAEADNYPV